jgi:hypothetical protein
MRAWAARGAVLALVGGLNVLVGPALLGGPTAANAADPCGTSGNEIACENSKPGTPMAQWDDFYGAGAESIQGFSTKMSVDAGETVQFKIDTDARAYTIEIYRTGWYGGDGARRIATIAPTATLPQNQPNCINDLTTELYDCGNWAVSASWQVPSTAVSGVYLARLHRADTDESSHITFIVRDDDGASKVVFQTSDTTWQAYNAYGGSNYYWGGANGRAYKVSYNRPITTRGDVDWGRDFYFANEYPMVRFLERNGYDVSYVAGLDVATRPGLLTSHGTFLSVGHDEYWTGPQRANVKAARDAGVNLQFLSGNEMYWRSRLEPSIDGSNTPNRTLVTYKETWANTKIDPSAEWTGTYRDPRFASQANGGGMPENALIGTMYMVNHDDLAVTVSAAEGKRRLWRNTSLTSMTAGTSRALAPHTIGYESNEDVDNGFRPGGMVRLSTTVGPTPQCVTEFGNRVEPGQTTHNLTLYKAPSGALVFSAGSVQWSWGLDDVHDTPYAHEPADVRMQQAQVNLLADMGAQPTTLMSGLVAATKSTDTTGPTVNVTTPTNGTARTNGTKVTVSGTAADSGGGIVAGVEVSTDGGTTWRPATGTTSWTYDYIQSGRGGTAVRVRAMDDSANIGATVTRNVTVACPCSVFGQTVPAKPDAGDGSAVELGLRFSPTETGYVSGVRFYKSAANTGSHVGSLWTAAGQRLASVTFSGETATGWQKADFAAPVPVTAGTTYVVSYTAPQGHYAAEKYAFSYGNLVRTPLQVAGGFGAAPAGVYGGAGSFPVESFGNSNYFVDAMWLGEETAPLTVSQRAPLPGASSILPTSVVSGVLSKPIVSSSLSVTLTGPGGAAVAGTRTYDATTRTVRFTPSSPLAWATTYTATVAAVVQYGNQTTTGRTWSFTTARPTSTVGVCPCGIFDDVTQPASIASGDKVPVTLGMRFSTNRAGTVTGVRFYKGPDNTGTHTGSLWSSTGTLLATGTFTGESTAGWQTLTFPSPVSVSPGVDYLVGYRSPTGEYSVTPNAFSSTNLSRGPLVVGATAGAFTYGTGAPTSTSASSYLVDVVFMKAPATVSVASQDPPAGAVDVPRGTNISVTLSDTIQPGWSLQVTVGGAAVAGSAQLVGGGTRIEFDPTSDLPADTVVSMTLSNVTSTEGAVLPTQTWSIRTVAPGRDTGQTIFSDQVPITADTADSSPIELGTAFVPATNGVVTGVRFYKGADNTGTHTGSVWSSSGTRLGTVTFVGETPTGWQTAIFANPVAVQAGQTYVVSYYAPNGHYASSPGFFATPLVNGDLTAPAGNNGLYAYGGGGGFPTGSYNQTAYFVDTLFSPTLAVSQRQPAPGATGVAPTVKPSISLTVPVTSGASLALRNGGQAVAGASALSADGKKLTFTPAAALPASTVLTATASGLATSDGQTLPDQTWTFTTESAAAVLTSLFADQVPVTTSVDDSSAIELGAAVTTSTAGSVTAIRFYKGAGNTGTHTGSIWDPAGNLLATVTFADETATGWQEAVLSTPVAISAGQTFVVSYYAPNGHYSATSGAFANPWVRGPLTVASNGNGRYRYGTGGGYPTDSWGQANYFVDVVFTS